MINQLKLSAHVLLFFGTYFVLFFNLSKNTLLYIDFKQVGILKTCSMRTNSVRYWNDKKEKLKKKFKNLTDKDLNFNEGKEKEMIEIVGNKLGKSKQELLKIIITL
jgi:hypothetical protein